jgi:hypothetical protein
LARLHLESISIMHSENEILQAIIDLPKGVDEIYDQALDRIRDEDADLAKRVLSWISFALRPLSIRELQTALSVIRGKEVQFGDMIPESKLISLCASLVIIDENDILHFVRA